MASEFETSTANAVRIVQFLHGLMEYGRARGVKSFPELFSRSWHDFLYALKREHPMEFNGFIFFDGSAGKWSAEMDNAMYGLTFICDERRGDHRVSLKPDILPVKDGRFFSGEPNFDEVVATAFCIAAGIDGFLEYY